MNYDEDINEQWQQLLIRYKDELPLAFLDDAFVAGLMSEFFYEQLAYYARQTAPLGKREVKKIR